MCVSVCTASGCARSLCLIPYSRQVDGCGACRTQLGFHSVVEGHTGLVERVAPWLQGELGPLGCPGWIGRGRDRDIEKEKSKASR